MKILKAVIKPAIGIGIITFLLLKGDIQPDLLIGAFQNHSGFILIAMAINIGLIIIAGVRWYLLVRCVGIKTSFSNIFSLHMIGMFFVTLIPGGTGGDVVKGYYIYRNSPSKKGLALTSIVMDRVVGVYALITLGLLGISMNTNMAFTHPELRWNSWFFLTVFGIATLTISLFFSPLGSKIPAHKIIDKLPGKKILKGLFEAFQIYRSHPGILFGTYLMTLVVHGGILMVFYFTALSLDVDLPLVKHGFIVPLLTAINGLPISPGGIGIGEAAAETLYGLMNCSQGAEILILFHFYVLIVAAAGAPFYFLYKKSR